MGDKFILLENLRVALGCEYLSDLRFEPYNSQAKALLKNIDLSKFSSWEIYNTFDYIWEELILCSSHIFI